jgi:mannosyltransferase OCH1-like enzyme
MSEKSYTTQLKSDYIRLCLLEEHGGIYLDLTTIFYDDLTWLSLENLLES